jgi:hypothetical protein
MMERLNLSAHQKNRPLNANPEAIHQIRGQAAESITSWLRPWPSLPEQQVRPELQLVLELEQQPVPSVLHADLSVHQFQQ